MTPAPRAEVVDLLERLIREYVETGVRSPALDSRKQWSTGSERTLALACVAASVTAYRALADRQNAELAHREALLAGDVPADEQWLRDTGISP